MNEKLIPGILLKEFYCVFYKTIEDLFENETGVKVEIAAEEEWLRGTSKIYNIKEEDSKFHDPENDVQDWKESEDKSYWLMGGLHTIFYFLALKKRIPYGSYIIYNEDVSIK
jgi:hypothetical protein